MKQRKKFELVIQDLHRGIAAPSPEDRRKLLEHSSWRITRFADELRSDPLKVGSLIGVVRLLRDLGGAGSTLAEEEILEALDYVARVAGELVGDSGKSSIQDDEGYRAVQVLKLVGAYAEDCLQFRRPRDSFGGRRRSAAFEILETVSLHIPVLGVLEFARSTLTNSKGNDTRGALEFLKGHFERLETHPDPELTGSILKLAERAGSRSVAFAALDLLVSTGVIGEFEALDLLSAWKERAARKH